MILRGLIKYIFSQDTVSITDKIVCTYDPCRISHKVHRHRNQYKETRLLFLSSLFLIHRYQPG